MSVLKEEVGDREFGGWIRYFPVNFLLASPISQFYFCKNPIPSSSFALSKTQSQYLKFHFSEKTISQLLVPILMPQLLSG